MFVALAALAWWHPVRYLQQKRYFEESDATRAGEIEKRSKNSNVAQTSV